MTCETLVISSVVGLALTAAVLSFQIITDRKAGRNNPEAERKRKVNCRYYHSIKTSFFS